MWCDPQQLRRYGPMVPAAFQARSKPGFANAVHGYMLVDTGAQGIAIDEQVAAELRLQPAAKKEVSGIEGKAKLQTYSANLILQVSDVNGKSGMLRIPLEPFAARHLRSNHEEWQLKTVDGEPMVVIGILGRLFLQFVTLTYSGTTGSFKMTIHKTVLYPQT